MRYYRDMSKAQRWRIADKLAEERLAAIDEASDEVKIKRTFYTRYGKRLLDIAISLCALTITAPVNLIIGVITYLTIGSPVLFRQTRVGKGGKPFVLCKFRSMTNQTDEKGEPLPPPERVTSFGRLIRKTSLDELLCLVNVLKGDMSIIGPRPLLPEYTHRYSKRHRARLAIRPGLECPPRFDADKIWTWHERFENDIWYVENASFTVDCRLLVNFLKYMLSKKNAAIRAEANAGIFMGYSESGEAITLADVPAEYIDSALAAETVE